MSIKKALYTAGQDNFIPSAPYSIEDLGVDKGLILDLVLKAAGIAPQFTTNWMASYVQLPLGIIAALLEQHRVDLMIEILGPAEGYGYRYAISKRGRERVAHLLQISGYIGPAPVSLEAYTTQLKRQIESYSKITKQDLSEALAGLVLAEQIEEIAGLALSSNRSLFLSGPAGNGKTTLGRQLYSALKGVLWIPHCIAIENNIIRLYDPHCHIKTKDPLPQSYDQRWVCIQRPLIIAGGEMTLGTLDLSYHHALHYYEAPLHMKANGGIFLIDDFGRQHIEPVELLNRWIIPLEHQTDFLTLHTGQKIDVPFLLMLIIATNLNPDDVTDPAFLRRLGYRLRLDLPSEEHYGQIFQQYAKRYEIAADASLITYLLERYKSEKRPFRACEPRDLIERVRDICLYRKHPLTLNEEMLDLAWRGYFGN